MFFFLFFFVFFFCSSWLINDDYLELLHVELISLAIKTIVDFSEKPYLRFFVYDQKKMQKFLSC